MSKRELKKYLSTLTKAQLEDQLIDLYQRFKEVKAFYDFAFNPNEQKLLDECKFKITKEYFPVNGRKPKARRSVAQKYIKHFISLGADPVLIAEVMLYNIEVAQAFSADRTIKQDSFYSSMLKSFQEAVHFMHENGLFKNNLHRLEKIVDETIAQHWFNYRAFENEMDKLPT
ncbi:MAG: DUF6155 family protein [Salinivirgaceae bacterium]